MSTILEADETGALHLPPSVLPHPGPHRRYRVAAENGHVVVNEVKSEPAVAQKDRGAWLDELARRRARNVTGTPGTPLQQILEEIREDPR